MFKNLPSSVGKRNTFWTPTTIFVSVAVHALVLGGAYAGMTAAPEEVKEKVEDLVLLDIKEPEPPKAPEPPPPPPPPPPPEAAAPPPVVKGTQTLVPPKEPPKGVQEEDKSAKAVNLEDFSGRGKEGGVAAGVPEGIAKPQVEKVDSSNFVYDQSNVGTAASITDATRRELARLLERNYPPLLRDSGVEGQSVMQFVVTEDGRVDPNSIKVVSSTHEQFGTASAKVLERAKFNPAKVGNRNVRMLLQLPIGWKLSR